MDKNKAIEKIKKCLALNGCLFAHGVAMARGRKNKEVAADAFIYGVRKRLQFAKEIAP